MIRIAAGLIATLSVIGMAQAEDLRPLQARSIEVGAPAALPTTRCPTMVFGLSPPWPEKSEYLFGSSRRWRLDRASFCRCPRR